MHVGQIETRDHGNFEEFDITEGGFMTFWEFFWQGPIAICLGCMLNGQLKQPVNGNTPTFKAAKPVGAAMAHTKNTTYQGLCDRHGTSVSFLHDNNACTTIIIILILNTPSIIILL